MPHKVFVSHAQRDRIPADAVVAHLEQAGVACWIAPRDIMPGASWPKAIVAAIGKSQVMVLVFSKHSNDSEHVKREVEIAIKRGITVVPLRIEDCVPEGELEFFLSSAHWMDAITPPLERHLQHFGSKVRAVLENPSDPVEAFTSASVPQSVPQAKPATWNRVPVKVVGAALLIVIVAGLWIMTKGPGNSANLPVTQDDPLATGSTMPTPSPTEGSPDDHGQASSIDPQTIAEMDDYYDQRNKGLSEEYLLRRGPIRFRAWLQAADDGYAPAQYAVAMLYWFGIGFSQSEEAAVEWLQKSADQNEPAALTALGYTYANGSGGLSIDDDAYIAYTVAAADAGDVGGMRNLAWDYRNGSGTITKDWHQATIWYKRAAEAGYPPAMLALAQMYATGNEDLPANPDLSKTWFQRAAEAGNPYAQAALFGEPFIPALSKYAQTLSNESTSTPEAAGEALREVESLVEQYQGLRFETQLAIMSDWRIRDSVVAIEAAEDGDPVKVILERMSERLIVQFGSSHRVVRQRTLYTFAGATVSTFERLQKDERWYDIALFWDSSYDDLSIGFDPPNDAEPLIRELRICTLALYNDGRRNQASKLVDTVIAMQDVHLRDRPWDWYAKEAYTGFGFEVAEIATLLGDHTRSQDLLHRSWSLLFGRYGEEEFVDEFRGELPLKNAIPLGMTDEAAARFMQFADDDTIDAFRAKSTVEVPSRSTMKYTIPTKFFGGVIPSFDVYILDGPRGYLELQDQFRWVYEYRGGVVPDDVKTSFRKLFELAKKNNVSYPDLCAYALDAANQEKNEVDDTETGGD